MKIEERVKIYLHNPTGNICIEFPFPGKTNYVVWNGSTGYGKNSLKECLDYLLEQFPEVPIRVKELFVTTTTIINADK